MDAWNHGEYRTLYIQTPFLYISTYDKAKFTNEAQQEIHNHTEQKTQNNRNNIFK